MITLRAPVKGALLGAALHALAGCASLSSERAAPPASSLCSEKLAGEYRTIELTAFVEDRAVPITVFAPSSGGTYPLVGFSHGAFAAPDRYTAMLGPLAAGGFIVVAPMHIDSEEMGLPEPPSRMEQWNTRNEDMRLALTLSREIKDRLTQDGLRVARENATAMGHSFGAVMAQFAGGARPIPTASNPPELRVQNVRAVVAYSPPGPIPGRLSSHSWSSLTVPSLTLTGDADLLPGFIDDWTLHKASFESAPAGSAALWTGSGVDHYFGGMFGREKPADETSQKMFARSLAQTLGFIEKNIGHPTPCEAGETISGENYERN